MALVSLGESKMYMGKPVMRDSSNFRGPGVEVHESKHQLGAEGVAFEWLGESIMFMGKTEMGDF